MTLCQPLPERMRPTELASFVGQTHLSERLQTLMTAPRLPSLLLFGPPGCGKSTLALLLARARGGVVLRLSAPEAGLQQLRRRLSGVDVLVLDELHRFSKAQQDFFLPLLESGELTMIATTTENPSFSVTRQLLSRLHVLRCSIEKTIAALNCSFYNLYIVLSNHLIGTVSLTWDFVTVI